MAAEIHSVHPELFAGYRTEFSPPAERILTTPAARQVFSDFMWHYVGDPNVPACLREREQPAVARVSSAGDAIISYRTVRVSGHTELGSLVHVRENAGERDCRDRYYVAIGDLSSGELREERVLEAEYQSSVQGGLIGLLYLDHPDNDEWPKRYWPTIRLTQHGFFYSPGFDRREEQVDDILLLFDEVARSQAARGYLRPLE